MSQRATRWRVTVAAPRASEGKEWRLRIKPPTGAVDETGKRYGEQRLASGTVDRAEAERLALEREAQLNAALPSARGGDGLTLVELLFEHETKRAGIEPQTLVKLKIVRRHVQRVLGSILVSRIDEADVLRLQDALAADVKPSTVNCYLALVAGAWNKWARPRKLVAKPWPKVPNLAKQETRKRPYTPQELERVLGWIAENAAGWLPLFLSLADTGARVSELLGTRGCDWNPQTGALLLTRTKTKRSRTVFVSSDTAAMIGTPPADAPVFVTPSDHMRDRGKAPTRHGVTDVLRRAFRALGWPSGVLDVHSLRRSFVTDAKRAGVTDALGRRVTGHASETQYDSYERHAIGDDLAGVTERIRAYRSSLSPSPSRGGRAPHRVASARGATVQESRDRATRKPMFPDGLGASGEAPTPSAESPPRVDQAPAGVVRAWDRDVLAEVLGNIAGLGPEARDALRALRVDAELAATFYAALADAWPNESPVEVLPHRARG